MQHRIEFVLFQLFKWIVLSLPLKSAQRLGYYIGSAAYLLVSSRRNIALENLRYAFPEKSEPERIAIAKGAFRNYGITFVELLWFPNLNEARIRNLMQVKNMELMTEAHRRSKGMVILAGHFGNWELIALGAALLSRLPFAIIVQTQNNVLVDEVINRHRCLFGNKVVPMGISIREIIRTLAEGGIVAIAPDQSGPEEGVFVDFFGRCVATHQGPAVFALRSGVPVQMGFIIRKSDGTYDVIVEEVPTADLNGYNKDNILELTRRHTALLEKYIRLYPDHWLWMHRRWKHTLESAQQQERSLNTASV
jgi:Kdo2-lipid IVA lauroyltransferase/acyltransferase